jgi:adenylate kinase
MCDILKDWLTRHPSGWVLDGFPRTLAQDEFLNDWLKQQGDRIDVAVALEVPKTELILRIEERVECPACRWSGQASQLHDGSKCPSCGAKAARRDDDSLENFLRRYEEYTEHTVPVIERYRGADMLAPVDATQPIEVVASLVQDSVNQLKEDGQTS